ncbi:uncharacterized protein J3D65DRAFT_314040 [Phyllosticta citribraziliensis]|uniref:Uncharacterized protein n=1 Tax=Phyllosticta citribraziliensis TaxID=989973 RepID=A0ABR1LU64_9PEZI
MINWSHFPSNPELLLSPEPGRTRRRMAAMVLLPVGCQDLRLRLIVHLVTLVVVVVDAKETPASPAFFGIAQARSGGSSGHQYCCAPFALLSFQNGITYAHHSTERGKRGVADAMTQADSSAKTGRIAGDERIAGHPLAARPLCPRPRRGPRRPSNSASKLRLVVHALNTKWLRTEVARQQPFCFHAQALVATLIGLSGLAPLQRAIGRVCW